MNATVMDDSILDQYVTSAPSDQNALDIFRGQWAFRLPAKFADLRAGHIPAFEDPRIHWALKVIGGVQNKGVLELGPLEAGHTYMLERSGSRSILAIEANHRAYLKCLVMKEILGLHRSRFICGDFVKYLQDMPSHYDLCLASGVLYHLIKPVEVIALASKVADYIFIWTHYYDRDIVAKDAKLAARFNGVSPANMQAFVIVCIATSTERLSTF